MKDEVNARYVAALIRPGHFRLLPFATVCKLHPVRHGEMGESRARRADTAADVVTQKSGDEVMQ